MERIRAAINRTGDGHGVGNQLTTLHVHIDVMTGGGWQTRHSFQDDTKSLCVSGRRVLTVLLAQRFPFLEVDPELYVRRHMDVDQVRHKLKERVADELKETDLCARDIVVALAIAQWRNWYRKSPFLVPQSPELIRNALGPFFVLIPRLRRVVEIRKLDRGSEQKSHVNVAILER